MLKYSDFLLQPMRNFKFKVMKEIKFKDITIPVGFTSDGASVPRPFWVVFPPNRTDYLPCAIIHDFLCDLEEYDKADLYFLDCMNSLHIRPTTKYPIIYSVRVYHFLRYKLPELFYRRIK